MTRVFLYPLSFLKGRLAKADRFFIAKIVLTAHYKYIYDGQGNIVRSIDITFKKEYNYEYEDGKIVRATESDIIISNEIVTSKTVANTIRYYYDSEGTMTKKVITAKDGTVQTIYYEQSENDSQVVKFTAGGRTVTSHSKTDSFGRKVFDELQLGTDFVSRQFVYHAGKVTDEHKEKAKVKSSATTQLVSQIILSNGTTLSYGYDAEERITSVVEAYEIDGVPVTNTTLYTYDALGQLETETRDGITTKFKYDNYGNIAAKGVVDETGEIAEATKISYVYGNDTWKDLLTSYNGHTLTWEKGRQLKSFDDIQYTYNANGIRTSKTVNNIRHDYALDGAKILRECWNFDESINSYRDILVPLYDNEESVCGIVYNNAPYYFHKNLQGDIIGIVDKSSKVVANYSYDAWGVCTVKQDSVGIATINPYRYRGYYFDEETGMYYLQSRYYDAQVGRFVNGDDTRFVVDNENVVELNFFVYCKNCSNNMIDELGYEANYITNQNAPSYKNLKLTKNTTVGQMGCGAVAVYNVLHKYSKKVNFKKMIPKLLNIPTVVWGINLLYNYFFNNGVSVFSMISYLQTKFWWVSYSFLNTYLWGIRAELAGAIIVAYWRPKNKSGHYIAGIKCGGGVGGRFNFYNTGNDLGKNKGSMSIWRLIDVLKQKGYIPLCIIAVASKKGWW